MKILITGASGLVGSALIPVLHVAGHQVTRLVRSQSRSADEVQWDPRTDIGDLARLEGMDAVIHLAGESIAAGRWTAEQKARIRNSRVQGTQTLCQALTQLALPPKVLISASAMGYYGDRGEEVLHEESTPGRGFLPEICLAWEEVSYCSASASCSVQPEARSRRCCFPSSSDLVVSLVPVNST